MTGPIAGARAPQVTTLVWARRPDRLLDLLTSLRRQTVMPARIVLCDDSPGGAIAAALAAEPLRSAVADLDIAVLAGSGQGAARSRTQLLQAFGGATPLFHLLADDALIHPNFYERHQTAHAQVRVHGSVSRRWTALDSGQPVGDLPVPPAVQGHADRLLVLHAQVLFHAIADDATNWLGDLSNAVFSAEVAGIFLDPRLAAVRCDGPGDLGAFLNASVGAPLAYLNEHLGLVRPDPAAAPDERRAALDGLAHLALVIAGRRLGKLGAAQAEASLARHGAQFAARFAGRPEWAELCAAAFHLAESSAQAEQRFVDRWHALAAAGEGTSPTRPRISVCIPVYNGEKYLPETLDSALAQTCGDFELLCIDDCSTDGSLALLEARAALDPRMRVVRMPRNQGTAPKVLNRVLPELRGDYFVYASQDDLFSRDWLERMLARAVETGADAVVPELVFHHSQDPSKDRSLVGLRGDRSAVLTGREAAFLSLDWTIPGNALWNAAMVRRLGFAEFSMNSDEYSGRVFYLNCNQVVFSGGRFLYRQDNEMAITKKVSYKTFDMPYTYFRLFLLFRENGYPQAVWQREALRSIQSLRQLVQWLDVHRGGWPAHDVQEAEARIAHCRRCLDEHGVAALFALAPGMAAVA